ncbi:uncharacterized protein [Arachis hypogaea]|uniref:uncharacterized protein isoform X3 n=1 Tax=Arachis hypogaea TaxID=3818 RepID=UPI003B20E28D
MALYLQNLYIEFYDVMSVPMAIALSGQFLLGQPVMVKPSEAEKNLVRLSLSSCLLMKVGTAKVLDLCSLHALKVREMHGA